MPYEGPDALNWGISRFKPVDYFNIRRLKLPMGRMSYWVLAWSIIVDGVLRIRPVAKGPALLLR